MDNGMVIKGDWESLLNLKGEKLLFVKRTHTLTLALPIFITSFISTLFIFASFMLFSYLVPSFQLFIISTLLIVTTALSLIAYELVYWYFHLFVLTSRKIIEVGYTPLYSHIVNDVFLDKVNCTEVDLSSKGFFHELIDMSDVIITFDRPTHQDEFVIRDVKNGDELSKFLIQQLMDTPKEVKEEMIWLKERRSIVPRVVI